MFACTFATYCFIDHYFNSFGYKQDIRVAAVNDDEIITAALIAMFYFSDYIDLTRVV